jgi:DNA invertase Pin-like site-specific DNA recombinase
MVMQMVASSAEFERAMLKARTTIGLEAARKEGRVGGRKPNARRQQQQIVQMVRKASKTADAARLFRVQRAMVGRFLQRRLAAQAQACCYRASIAANSTNERRLADSHPNVIG